MISLWRIEFDNDTYNSDENRTTFVDIDRDGNYDCFLSSYSNNRDQIYFVRNLGRYVRGIAFYKGFLFVRFLKSVKNRLRLAI